MATTPLSPTPTDSPRPTPCNKSGDKPAAWMLAEALAAYGVRKVISSPGSRNAPLISALVRFGDADVVPVVDERSAAFIALGYASISRHPVALVCTSGSAVLNYAPAVAEAYYRKVPLIVISADRPACWIGQDDSQTIRQPGALANIVKTTVNIRAEIATEEERWTANRLLNEALHSALHRRPGPVHINISLTEPLTLAATPVATPAFRPIDYIATERKIAVQQARDLAAEAVGERILIVGGFMPPSQQVSAAMTLLAEQPQTIVMADALANLHSKGIIHHPDLVVGASETAENPQSFPTLLITMGGALLSRRVKEHLRQLPGLKHWHIGDNASLIDSYFSLTKRIEISEDDFFPRWSRALAHLNRISPPALTRFRSIWLDTYKRMVQTPDDASHSRLTQPVAVSLLLKAAPKRWNLQLSNGLTPRIATLSDACIFHRCDCNRGVSGIEGSVSTAVGASMAFSDTTLLLAGDMSMQYDLAALSSGLLSPRLKIAVFNNGGGGIFNRVATTRNLPERERYLQCPSPLPLHEAATAYGLEYFRAETPGQLTDLLPRFIHTADKPVILEIIINETT